MDLENINGIFDLVTADNVKVFLKVWIWSDINDIFLRKVVHNRQVA